jgi:hypothetical protein
MINEVVNVISEALPDTAQAARAVIGRLRYPLKMPDGFTYEDMIIVRRYLNSILEEADNA